MIVGLGGTGRDILDLVVKAPVVEILCTTKRAGSALGDRRGPTSVEGHRDRVATGILFGDAEADESDMTGERALLYPSIGNWQFPCRSHYWIRRNRIIWAGRRLKAWIKAIEWTAPRGRVDHFTRQSIWLRTAGPRCARAVAEGAIRWCDTLL